MSEATKAKAKRLRARKKVEIEIISVPPDTEAWFDCETICALIRVSRSKFKAMVADGKYPPADHMLGNRGRWRKATHNQWMLSQPRPDAMPREPFPRG